MPFAKFRVELAVKGGAAVLQDRLPFDEVALLQENRAFLLRQGAGGGVCMVCRGGGGGGGGGLVSLLLDCWVSGRTGLWLSSRCPRAGPACSEPLTPSSFLQLAAPAHGDLPHTLAVPDGARSILPCRCAPSCLQSAADWRAGGACSQL